MSFLKFRAWLMTMDYVQKFDIELEKDVYYAGEVIRGKVVVVTTENIKVKGKVASLTKAVEINKCKLI